MKYVVVFLLSLVVSTGVIYSGPKDGSQPESGVTADIRPETKRYHTFNLCTMQGEPWDRADSLANDYCIYVTQLKDSIILETLCPEKVTLTFLKDDGFWYAYRESDLEMKGSCTMNGQCAKRYYTFLYNGKVIEYSQSYIGDEIWRQIHIKTRNLYRGIYINDDIDIMLENLTPQEVLTKCRAFLNGGGKGIGYDVSSRNIHNGIFYQIMNTAAYRPEFPWTHIWGFPEAVWYSEESWGRNNKVYIMREELPPTVHLDYDENHIFEAVDEMPIFPDGDAALIAYIKEHIQYPPTAAANGVQGMVLVQFVVKKDGSIAEIKVVRSMGAELDAEAVRLVSELPNFIPGRLHGNKVNVRCMLPVRFKLPEGK